MKLAEAGGHHRRVNAVDVAASALARVMPGGLTPRIDRLRNDVNGVLAGFGARPRPYSAPNAPMEQPRPLGDIDPIEHLLPGRRLRRRWITLRTDLRWLRRDLTGAPRPATVALGRTSRYRAAVTTPATALEPRPVSVKRVERETADAVTLTLEEIDGRPIAFEAGQFLTFHLEVDGAPLRRAYSLSSSPLDGVATITVKRIEGGGRASTWMQGVEPGARLRVLGPSGSFLAGDEPELVMIAGGSGITPVISIAETVARSRPGAPVRLLYGNRRPEDVIFAARLDALAAELPGLEVTHALEVPPEGWTGVVGRLDEPTIARWLDGLGEGERGYYVCGPAPMMHAAREAISSRAPGAVIREERFQSPGTATPPRALPSAPIAVTLSVRGAEREVEVAPGETILEAAVAAGVALPFSCAMGGCAACKGSLTEGEVVMDEPNCLTERERAEGAVLTCCARPTERARVEIE